MFNSDFHIGNKNIASSDFDPLGVEGKHVGSVIVCGGRWEKIAGSPYWRVY